MTEAKRVESKVWEVVNRERRKVRRMEKDIKREELWS